jgi:hypothetical protein
MAVGTLPQLGTGNTGPFENIARSSEFTGLGVSPSATGGGGTTVPEPSTFILLASGLLGLAIYIRLGSSELAFHERIILQGKWFPLNKRH